MNSSCIIQVIVFGGMKIEKSGMEVEKKKVFVMVHGWKGRLDRTSLYSG